MSTIRINANELTQDLGDILKRLEDDSRYEVSVESKYSDAPVPWDTTIDVRPLVSKGLCLVLEGACGPGGGNQGECIVRIPISIAHYYQISVTAFDGATIPTELLDVAEKES